MHQEKASKRAAKEDKAEPGAVPAYLIDRENVNRAKVCRCVWRCVWCLLPSCCLGGVGW